MAIVLAEPDAYVYAEIIIQAVENQTRLYVPASVLVEAGIAAEQRNSGEILDAWLDSLHPEILPLVDVVAELDCQVFRTFGRGRHTHDINFGACMSYANSWYLE